jgi:hypothetical protein
MPRWIRFTLFLLIGLAAGLFYGWIVSPLEFVDTSPQHLRADYRADCVLMVAETYASSRDPEPAARSLSLLSPQPPAAVVFEALDYARAAGYDPADLALLQSLLTAMQTYSGAIP